MSRMQRAAILLTLLDQLREHGSWCGETHIQKSAYFLQELLQVPLEFDFMLYKHGPYSFDLSDEITALRADQLLTVQSRSSYGPSILPSPASRSFLGRYPHTRKRYVQQIRFVASRLGDKNVAHLEKLATALFVTRESSEPPSVEIRSERVHQLKPHISTAEARQAVQDVDVIIRDAQDSIGR